MKTFQEQVRIIIESASRKANEFLEDMNVEGIELDKELISGAVGAFEKKIKSQIKSNK